MTEMLATDFHDTRRTFDRTKDVAKLFGCDTRNVNYRWSIFSRYLRQIPLGSKVLDFGAGSLRETFELSAMGFEVVSLDINADTLRAYFQEYDWSHRKAPTIVTDISQLSNHSTFKLITAFDVLEHLDRPNHLLKQMIDILEPSALIFCTVPNRRSLFEILSRIKLKLGLALGHKFAPGEPHLQFNSPEEWREIFERAGLAVLAHEMTIGFFVNTWASIASMISLPIRRLFPRAKIDRLGVLASPRIMSALNVLDHHTEKVFRGLYGWNLFVLSPIK